MIVGNDQTLISELKTVLSDNFKIKKFGRNEIFLRFKIARSKHGITLNQKKYDLENNNLKIIFMFNAMKTTNEKKKNSDKRN